MVHHRTRKHHRKPQRGGRSDEEAQNSVPTVVDDDMKDVPGGEVLPLSQSGGRRRGGRRRGGSRKSVRKSIRRSGRRSHKGGFIAGLGSILNDALVPIGLSLYTIKKSRRNRVRRGGDDIA